jgi:hypothetical protein
MTIQISALVCPACGSCLRAWTKDGVLISTRPDLKDWRERCGFVSEVSGPTACEPLSRVLTPERDERALKHRG